MEVRRLLAIVLVLVPTWLYAQQGPVPVRTSATLSASSADTTSTCPATACVDLNVSGYGSISFQVTGTWVATITFEGSVDGTNFKTLSVTTSSASASSTTTTSNNVFTGAVGGMSHARARVSAYTSGSPVVSILAAPSGGGSGGGGGGSSSSVTIQDATTSSQKVAVNASGQMSITCANCSGSGASAVDDSVFTATVTSGAPMMGFFHSTIDAVTDGNTGVVGMDSKRNAFFVIRDAAGNARGANVDASSRLNVTMSSGSVLSGAFASGALASGSVASGAVASGAIASGAFAAGSIGSGAIASGAVASGAVASGAYASGSISDGADVTLGAKADAKSTATDTTAVTVMQVLKEISAMEQAPASRAVTNAGTFATQSAITAASGSIQSGAIASGAIASGAVASGAVASGAFASGAIGSGAIASGAVASGAYAAGSIADGADVTQGAKADAKSTATDTTSVSIMSVLKEISAMEQAPASRAVTNAGTFAVQASLTGTPYESKPVATATTTNATLTCYITSAASTNSTNCKGSAGNVYAYHITNTTTTNYFLRVYNASSAPTCSSSTGFVETIPALGASANGGVNGRVNVIPQAFTTGIGFCLTGGGSSTDNTNAATGVYVTIEYF